MAELFELPTHQDSRGALTVLEKVLPFDIKRVYWMHQLSGENRGGHRHKQTIQALTCLHGACKVKVVCNGEQTFHINQPNQVLILNPEDWHEMTDITKDAVIMVMASHEYDAADYIKEPV